jgi:hypothetical protein
VDENEPCIPHRFRIDASFLFELKILTVVVTTDKGMCGSINTNINRFVKQMPGARDMSFVLIGEKSISFTFTFPFLSLAPFSLSRFSVDNEYLILLVFFDDDDDDDVVVVVDKVCSLWSVHSSKISSHFQVITFHHTLSLTLIFNY